MFHYTNSQKICSTQSIFIRDLIFRMPFIIHRNSPELHTHLFKRQHIYSIPILTSYHATTVSKLNFTPTAEFHYTNSTSNVSTRFVSDEVNRLLQNWRHGVLKMEEGRGICCQLCISSPLLISEEELHLFSWDPQGQWISPVMRHFSSTSKMSIYTRRWRLTCV